MPEETIANAEEQVLTQPAEPEASEAEPEVDWKARFEEADTNLKATQSNLPDRERKLQEQSARLSSMDALEKKVEQLAENQMESLDYIDYLTQSLGQANQQPQVDEYGQPIQQPQQRTVPTTRREAWKAQREQEAIIQGQVSQLVKATADAGIEWNDPQFQAEVITGTTSPVEAMARIPAFLRKQADTKAAYAQKAEEDAKVAAKAKELEDSGVTVATSTPNSGGSLPGKRIYKKEELRDHQFYIDNKDDILLAQKEGRIK